MTNRRKIIWGLLLLVFALSVWLVGRNCFIGSGVMDKVPWAHCSAGCYSSIDLKAPWLDEGSRTLWPDCGREPCAARTVSVFSVSAMPEGAYGTAFVSIANDCERVGRFDYSTPGVVVVTGTFSGDFNEQGTGTVDLSSALIRTSVVADKLANMVSYTFCVDDLEHETLIYDASSNDETCTQFSAEQIISALRDVEAGRKTFSDIFNEHGIDRTMYKDLKRMYQPHLGQSE